MTKEIPPVPNAEKENEQIETTEQETKEYAVAVDPKAMEDLEDLNREIHLKRKETYDTIRDIQAKKDKGDEPWRETSAQPKQEYKAQKPTNKLRNGIMALKIGLAGILGLGATKGAAATNTPDSLGKGQQKEVVIDGVSVKEGLKIRELTSAERQDWNAFLDFVKEKGYEGSEKLDKGSDALARSLFAKYKELHPTTTIDYSSVASVQMEMQKLKKSMQEFSKRRNEADSATIMAGVSKVDGWFGHATSQFRFPFVVSEQYHNDELVSKKNLGLVNPNLETTQKQKSMKKVPPGAVIEQLSGGKFYEDPETGDLVRVDD